MCKLFGLSSSRPAAPGELLCRFGAPGGAGLGYRLRTPSLVFTNRSNPFSCGETVSAGPNTEMGESAEFAN